MAVLKQGSTGPDVLALQTKLKALGFDPKGVDGNFGPGTTAALIAFQKSKNLQADGVAGPLTMTALQLLSDAIPLMTSPDSATPATPSVMPSAPGLNLSSLTGRLPASVISQIPETARRLALRLI